MSLITIQNLRKVFVNKEVITNLSFSIEANEKVLLLGKNGSGKSTLLRILSGLSSKTSGQAQVNVKKIGYTHHQSMMYGALTVRENLKFFHNMVSSSHDIDIFLESWKLFSIKDNIFRSLSQGQKTLASIARAFLQQPDILLLDEPTSFLDDATVNLLIEKISNLTCLIATHDVERFRRLATRIIVINDGLVGSDSKNSSTIEAINYYHRCNH